jgi:hypothetical protein
MGIFPLELGNILLEDRGEHVFAVVVRDQGRGEGEARFAYEEDVIFWRKGDRRGYVLFLLVGGLRRPGSLGWSRRLPWLPRLQGLLFWGIVMIEVRDAGLCGGDASPLVVLAHG